MSELTIDEQVAILMGGTEFGDEQIKDHMRDELRERLVESRRTGKPLRVYCGFDPTAPDIHLGHTVTMRKLRQFQDLGHHVIFLIGTFTGLIGDPSDKDKARPQRTAEELAENARTYARQAFRVLDPQRTEILYNADWLSRLTFVDVIDLASNFTVQQFLARDNFAKRHAAGDAIWLHEFLYALMQARDAVELETDVQLGATEQLFNLLSGRKLQEARGQRPQVCLTFPILVGTDGVERMSKSLGNYVGVDEAPEEKYGKTMSIPDFAMRNWFELATRWRPGQIDQLLDGVARGEVHPMDAKKQLAGEIVSMFDGDEAADRAAAHFERVHQCGELPEEMETRAIREPVAIVDLVYSAGFARSKSDARRLVQQKAVRLDGEPVLDIGYTVAPEGEQVLQVGRRKFLRVVGR